MSIYISFVGQIRLLDSLESALQAVFRFHEYIAIVIPDGFEGRFRLSEDKAKDSASLQSLYADYSSSSEHSDSPCVS